MIDTTERTEPCRAEPRRAASSHAVPSRAVLYRTMPSRAVPCCTVPSRAMPCHFARRQPKRMVHLIVKEWVFLYVTAKFLVTKMGKAFTV